MFAAHAFKNEELSEYPAARVTIRVQEKKQMSSPRFSFENNVAHCTAKIAIIVADLLRSVNFVYIIRL
jgi:hypothetical protein